MLSFVFSLSLRSGLVWSPFFVVSVSLVARLTVSVAGFLSVFRTVIVFVRLFRGIPPFMRVSFLLSVCILGSTTAFSAFRIVETCKAFLLHKIHVNRFLLALVVSLVKRVHLDSLSVERDYLESPCTRRLRALAELSGAGVFAGVLLMPVLPFVADFPKNVLSVVDSAARAGARFVYAAFGVTMRDGQRDFFLDGLNRAFPGQGVGEKYRKRYGTRYYCSSPRANELWELFSSRCKELGLLYEMRHIISAATKSYEDRQLSLFNE